MSEQVLVAAQYVSPGDVIKKLDGWHKVLNVRHVEGVGGVPMVFIKMNVRGRTHSTRIFGMQTIMVDPKPKTILRKGAAHA